MMRSFGVKCVALANGKFATQPRALFVQSLTFHASLACFQQPTPTVTLQRKNLRQYTTELSRLKQEFSREATSPARRIEIQRQLTATPLNTVQGIDGKVIVYFLQTLVAIQGSPLDRNAQLAADWISLHVESMPNQLLGDALAALQQLRFQGLTNLIDVVEPRLMATLERFYSGDRQSVSFESAVRMCDAILYTCRVRGYASELGRKACHNIASAVELLDPFGATAALPLLISLGRMTPMLRRELGGDQLAQHMKRCLENTGAQSAASSLSLKDSIDAFCATVRLDHISEPMIARICANRNELLIAPVQVADVLFSRWTAFRLLSRCDDESRKKAIVTLFETISDLLPNIDVETISPDAFGVLFSAVVFAVREQQSSKVALPDGVTPIVLPPTFISAVARLAKGDTPGDVLQLSNATLRHLLPALAHVAECRQLAQHIASCRITELVRIVGANPSVPNAPSTGSVAADDLCVLISADSLDTHEKEIAQLVHSMPHCFASYHTYLSTLAQVGTKAAKRLMREAAQTLVKSVPEMGPAQLSAMMAVYGASHIRHDGLCDAVVQQATKLTKELRLHDIVIVLSAMASVEYRNHRLFLDFAPIVMEHCKDANAPMVANLLASYAKMLVWNAKLFIALAHRAFELRDDFTPQQMITILTASTRMDFSHDELTLYFLGKLQEASSISMLSLVDCAHVAIAFSHTTARNAELFERLADRFIQHQHVMDAALIGEVLLAYGRISPRSDNRSNSESPMEAHRIFDGLSLRVVAIAPLCSPMTVAHICQAFAMIGKPHDELFAVFSERLRTSKDDFPAIVIAAILDAFAQLGVRDDRLFIEMIPRVRHVAQYGAPKDVANVVSAYTGVDLWHYKLFAKLADRAVAMKGQCRSVDLVKILKAYGKVKMRYDKLFLELSPRIQTLAHLLSPSDITTILEAYAVVEIFESGLFMVLADRIVSLHDQFEEHHWSVIASSVAQAQLQHDELSKCLALRVSRLASASS